MFCFCLWCRMKIVKKQHSSSCRYNACKRRSHSKKVRLWKGCVWKWGYREKRERTMEWGVTWWMNFTLGTVKSFLKFNLLHKFPKFNLVNGNKNFSYNFLPNNFEQISNLNIKKNWLYQKNKFIDLFFIKLIFICIYIVGGKLIFLIFILKKNYNNF